MALFVIAELLTKEPIVELGAFKDRSFAAGNVVMFVAFFNLMATIVLLPMYLQTLLGYTATLAGMVIGLGGISTVFIMPLVGVL
ncbi:drug resistance transporter, EmrB/QacA subfamily, partial [Candidatus Magnetoovum chiemensis]